MPFKPSNTFLLILIAIFFGALSGILGFIIIGAGNFKIPFVGKLDYAGSNLDNQIIIEQPRSVVVEQDTQVSQIENDLVPSLINIYHTKKTADPMVAAFTDRELIGRGFILTADGWVVTTAGVIGNFKGGYTAVGYQNKQYSLSDFTSDKATGLVFGKTTAANLPVARLGKSSDLRLGQTVAVVSGKNNLFLSHISHIGYSFAQSKDLALNSDFLKKRISLDKQLDASYEGSLVTNLKGEVVGVVVGGLVVPIDYFSNIVDNFLKNQTVVRASLGLDYIDLAQVDGLINLGDKGAYVVYEPLKGSAAFGLIKKGDVILKLNDNEFNSFRGLAEVLNNYKMGDKVELAVLRDSKSISVPVVLR